MATGRFEARRPPTQDRGPRINHQIRIRQIRVIEEASRGILLGRDTFSTGTIRSQTLDATLTAIEGFRQIMVGYKVVHVRAVATSAVREARNAEMVLDRIRGRTGIAFEIINEAEEVRLIYLAVRHALGKHSVFKGAATLLGWHEDVNDATIRGALQALMSEPLERRAMARCGRALIDGRGPDRLITALEVLLHPSRQIDLTEAA